MGFICNKFGMFYFKLFLKRSLFQNFSEFDQNDDHVIDSDEFVAMLDQVMKDEDYRVKTYHCYRN